jgi:hypothetical protein
MTREDPASELAEAATRSSIGTTRQRESAGPSSRSAQSSVTPERDRTRCARVDKASPSHTAFSLLETRFGVLSFPLAASGSVPDHPPTTSRWGGQEHRKRKDERGIGIGGVGGRRDEDGWGMSSGEQEEGEERREKKRDDGCDGSWSGRAGLEKRSGARGIGVSAGERGAPGAKATRAEWPGLAAEPDAVVAGRRLAGLAGGADEWAVGGGAEAGRAGAPRPCLERAQDYLGRCSAGSGRVVGGARASSCCFGAVVACWRACSTANRGRWSAELRARADQRIGAQGSSLRCGWSRPAAPAVPRSPRFARPRSRAVRPLPRPAPRGEGVARTTGSRGMS